MYRERWNSGWRFWEERNAFAMVWDVPAEAQAVELPHDAMLAVPPRADSPNGGNTGYRDGGTYVYVKAFEAPAAWRGQCICLRFEGVYSNAYVYVNGQLAAQHAYGFTGFLVNLSPFLRYEQENEIRVIVRNSTVNSRWYAGSGIYRDVWLLTADPVHIADEGVWVVTEELEADLAVLRVTTEISNEGRLPRNVVLETILVDPQGREAARQMTPVSVDGGDGVTLQQRMTVASPQAWSAETPMLYGCRSRVLVREDRIRGCESDGRDGDRRENDGVEIGGHETGGYVSDSCEKNRRRGCEHENDCCEIDRHTVTFGIRTVTVDARRGLRVNGEMVKLLGACIHHDSGLLGAAVYEDAQERQIRLLKQAGFNAVRMSHAPMAPAMLRACDRVGMYVLDEAFDQWTRAKSDDDYSTVFMDHACEDLSRMVRTDRQHPAVIMYSIGNEIPESATDAGARLAGRLCETIRGLDPTRPITAGINGVFMAGDAIGQIMADIQTDAEDSAGGNVNDFMTAMDTHMKEIVQHPAVTERLEKACAYLDVAGYNYMAARYAGDARAYPDRVMLGTETYPPEFYANWQLVKALPAVIGDYTWTGWDYIGEAGVGIPAYHAGEGGFGARFPCQLAYVGDIDLTGFRRPASYYREIAAGLRKEPYIAVQNPHHYAEHLIKTPWVISDSTHSWTWPGCEGRPVVVEVYATGDAVELMQDGQVIGVESLHEGIARFETVYRHGELRAVALQDGCRGAESMLRSAGEVTQIVLQMEPARADTELFYLTAELCDADGRLNPSKEREIEVDVSGGAHLLAVGSADPKSEFHPAGRTRTFGGRAQIILRRDGAEPIEVTVRSCEGDLAADVRS